MNLEGNRKIKCSCNTHARVHARAHTHPPNVRNRSRRGDKYKREGYTLLAAASSMYYGTC